MNVQCFFCGENIPTLEARHDPEICDRCWLSSEKQDAISRVWDARQELNDSLKDATKIKFKGEPLRITNIFVFNNGMTAVTDQFGEQMPDYQGKYEDVKDKIYTKIHDQDLRPSFHDAFTVPKLTP